MTHFFTFLQTNSPLFQPERTVDVSLFFGFWFSTEHQLDDEIRDQEELLDHYRHSALTGQEMP
jgi:hypothetical protein